MNDATPAKAGPRPAGSATRRRKKRHPRRPFWIGMVIGWTLIAIGVKGVFTNTGATPPARLFFWFVVLGLAHDVVVAPAIVGVGWVTRKVVPPVARVPVRVALALTAVIVLVSVPLLLGYGRTPSIPSALPLDYPRNLAFVVAAIWVVTAAYVAWRVLAARSLATS